MFALPIDDAAANTIAPLFVAAELLLLVIAPADEMPVPLIVSGLYKVKPLRSIAAPLLITFDAAVVLVPKGPFVIVAVEPVELTPSFKVPAEIVVPPE